MVEERQATWDDLQAVAKEDREDGFNMAPSDRLNYLKLGLDRSLRVTSYFYKGSLLAVAGVAATGLIGDAAHIWMMSTRAVDAHKLPFIRHAKKILAGLSYSKLTCLCDPGFGKTLEWLSYEGFALSGSIDIQGRRFHVLERLQ